MRVFCLLPVRNGAATLATYLESVRGFCSGVIALDDGSTDDTRERLEVHPLIKAVLANPPRKTYRGWNDSANRQRLLAACDDFAPDWIFWLDVDEHVPSCDIPRLQHFIEACARTD